MSQTKPVPKTCGTCLHFHFHYVLSFRDSLHPAYVPILSGHCAQPRLHNCGAERPACAHYAPQPVCSE